jgi:hypoxanthine phosphoribosyltransferase
VREELNKVKNTASCLYSHEDIQIAISRMADAINATMSDKNPVVLCVINGGIVTAGHLLTQLTFDLMLDSILVSRYQNSTSGTSEISWLYTPKTQIRDRHVLIVDDILDEGITLKAIKDWCYEQGVKSVSCAVLLDKVLDKSKPVTADYIGLTVDNQYLYGFGLDYKSYLRNINGIFACKE